MRPLDLPLVLLSVLGLACGRRQVAVDAASSPDVPLAGQVDSALGADRLDGAPLDIGVADAAAASPDRPGAHDQQGPDLEPIRVYRLPGDDSRFHDLRFVGS